VTRSALDRREAQGFGLLAESLALVFLSLKGYRVLARRYRAPGGEIDLIARRGDAIAFVEVKARPDLDCALSAITEEKRRRISKAARFWLARHRTASTFVLRGDAVCFAPWRLPKHIRAAFPLDLG
jgi:putative endonuclease